MARVTVEDCIDKIDNRFEMVLSASHRARQIFSGAEPHVELENDKPVVVALREISEGYITEEVLNEPENIVISSLGDSLNEADLTTTTIPTLTTPTLGSY